MTKVSSDCVPLSNLTTHVQNTVEARALTNVIRERNTTFFPVIPLNIKDLFGYNWHSRRRFLKSMSEIPWDTVVESSGASFDSIRDIFVHSLQAEHLWMRRLSGKGIEGIYAPQDAPFTKYTDVNSIREYSDKVEAETNECLEKFTDEKLQSVFEYKGRDGSVNRNKIEDILMHVIEEEIHHRGEILCIYWQHNIQPPYTSFTAYRNQTLS